MEVFMQRKSHYRISFYSYEAIARAYGLPTGIDEETCDRMNTMMQARSTDWKLTEARKRMAIFPQPAEIIRIDGLWVPIVVVNHNIHILPGIPRLFEQMVTAIQPRLEAMARDRGLFGYHRTQIATKKGEGDIAHFLSELQKRVKSENIKIGSYPRWGQSAEGVRVMVSVVGKGKAEVDAIGQEIARGIDGWAVEATDTTKN